MYFVYLKISAWVVTYNFFAFQANVMLEYNLDDAEKLLEKNYDAASRSLAQVEDDLGFIRDQTTTLEVSILFFLNFSFRRMLQTIKYGV